MGPYQVQPHRVKVSLEIMAIKAKIQTLQSTRTGVSPLYPGHNECLGRVILKYNI